MYTKKMLNTGCNKTFPVAITWKPFAFLVLVGTSRASPFAQVSLKPHLQVGKIASHDVAITLSMSFAKNPTGHCLDDF